MPLIPLFGAANFGKSSNVSAQRRINLYAEPIQGGDRAPMVLYGRPGLVEDAWQSLDGAAVSNGKPKAAVVQGPIRGMATNYDTSSGTLAQSSIYGVLGNVLFQYIGGVLYLQWANYNTSAPFTTTQGPVAIASDQLNILIADGSAGYYAPVATPSQCQPIASANFPAGATSACVVASHFIVNDPSNNGRFYWSDAGDVTTWNALSFATAEGAADPLAAVFESNGELLLFGTESLEFWAPTTDTDVFSRVQGSTIQWGTFAAQSIRKLSTGVAFLGRNRGGSRQVVLTEGYQPRVISTPDIEERINADPSPDNAVALTYTAAGHQFYQLNLTGTSLVYDMTSGLWSEFQTAGSRCAAQYSVGFNGRTYVSDYASMRLAYFDTNTYTDYGQTLARELTSRHIFTDGDRLSCWELFLDAETGVGAVGGTDPQIMLQVSKDGGHTFGNEMWVSLGAIGKYLVRAVWRRLGRGRDWVFRFRVTDPVKVVLLQAKMRME